MYQETLKLIVEHTRIVGGLEKSMEEWKDIKGWENYYQVSDLGRVRSLDRRITHNNGNQYFIKGVILKFYLDKDGYSRVNLKRNNKQKSYSVHRLVCEAYKANWDSTLEVNHLDFDRTNNNVCNLEMCTHSENVWHSTVNGRGRWDGIPSHIVQQIRQLKGYVGQRQLARLYSVARSTVSDIHNNKTRVYY